MANKYSSPFDGPHHFEEPEDNNLDAQDQFNTDRQSDAQDEPLLSQDPVRKPTGKREYLKNLAHTGSKKLSKATRNILDQGRKQPKSAGHAPTPPTGNTYRWEYDRFDGTVPDSIPELIMHIEAGRHPEILELAIKLKKRETPSSKQNTFSYKVLDAMLITIRNMRQNQEFDAIQSQTLEQLGRPYEYTRFE